ncbi:NAD-dependent epimerase/dehydratase family protein [Methylobacterium nigriterrae]|uniref:NAD-dependent epimerase/dehydratase family protein n=1 Tax=Methylobacterium nigriterrae TaxID=3127512 RepID=UPI0030134305
MTGKVLITGAAGRMGRTLQQHWQGRAVVGLDRIGADLAVDLLQGPDVCASAFAGIETVVHLAADPDPGSPFERGGYGNTLATLTVVAACLRADVRRLIFASSVWADAPAWGLSDRMTWYAASKLAGEALVRAWADQTGNPAVCLRPGYFDPDSGRTDDFNEALQVDVPYLCRHFDDALAWAGPGCAIRYAVGKLG